MPENMNTIRYVLSGTVAIPAGLTTVLAVVLVRRTHYITMNHWLSINQKEEQGHRMRTKMDFSNSNLTMEWYNQLSMKYSNLHPL